MKTTTRLSVFRHRMDWHAIPPALLDHARELACTRGGNPAERTQYYEAADDDPCLPGTFNARCVIAASLEPVDLFRFLARYVVWAEQAANDTRQLVLMHAVLACALRAMRVPKSQIGAWFPDYLQQVHDPLVALAVLDYRTADLLFAPIVPGMGDHDLLHKLHKRAMQLLLTRWIRARHGLELNDARDRRAVIFKAINGLCSGDRMVVRYLHASTPRFRRSFEPETAEGYQVWLAELPASAFGVRD